MAFDWTEFLTLAKELAQRTNEAYLRSAVSRAYYAAFGKARAFLQAEGVAFISVVALDFVHQPGNALNGGNRFARYFGGFFLSATHQV